MKREKKPRVRGGADLECGCRIEVGKGGATTLVINEDCDEHGGFAEALEEEDEEES
jgi:hypothetical protein